LSDSAKAKLDSWHTTVLDAADNVIELRREEMSKVTLEHLPKPDFYGEPVVAKPKFQGRFRSFDLLNQLATHNDDATKKAKLQAALQHLVDIDGGSHQGSVDAWEENKSTLSCS